MTILGDLLTDNGKKWAEEHGLKLDIVLPALGAWRYSASEDSLEFCCGAGEIYLTHLNSIEELVAAMAYLNITYHRGIVVTTINHGQSRVKAPWFKQLGFSDSGWAVNPNTRRKIKCFTLALPQGLFVKVLPTIAKATW